MPAPIKLQATVGAQTALHLPPTPTPGLLSNRRITFDLAQPPRRFLPVGPAHEPVGGVTLDPGSPLDPVGIPDGAARTGSLFDDSFDVNRKWVLPAFDLADDPDPAFAFKASQTEEVDQATGLPFNKGVVSMGLRKRIPADATAWRDAQPGRDLREIPLQDLEATLVLQTQKDGQPTGVACAATLSSPDGERFLLTADSILGVQVIALFQNLRHTGTATCVITATYRTRRVRPIPPLLPGQMAIMSLVYMIDVEAFRQTVQIGSKYAADPYRLEYTITKAGASRAIIDADDLRSFDVHQSEFVELVALGDVSARYPTIAKLYLGVLSRTVVAIPARYVIMRDATTCAATCQALLDSSPGLNQGCKFQFAFTLAPDVSDIDLLLLANALESRPEANLHGVRLRLPGTFDLGPGAALTSAFLTSSHFDQGAVEPRSIALSADIREQADSPPAVANANLVLNQLATGAEPFLSGHVGIRLDDAATIAITVPVVLSFTRTRPIGPGGLSLALDPATSAPTLHNGSAFDLQIERIAIQTPQGTTVRDVNQVLPASASLALDLPAGQAEVSVLSDCQIAAAGGLSRTQLFKLLQVSQVDVQNTQYLFSLSAAAVDFDGRGIDHIDATITLDGSPGVAVAPLVVRRERQFDSTRILLPIDKALAALAATVALAITFGDPAKPAVRFTMANDFGQHPIFALQDSDLQR